MNWFEVIFKIYEALQKFTIWFYDFLNWSVKVESKKGWSSGIANAIGLDTWNISFEVTVYGILGGVGLTTIVTLALIKLLPTL